MNKSLQSLLLFIPFIGFSQSNVTFQINMNQYTGSYNAVEVFGSFNNWQGGISIMTDANNDGVYDITVPIGPGGIQYLFAIDTGSFDYIVEDFTSTQPFCTVSGGGFTNRAYTVTTNATLPAVCWESCVDCGSTPTNNNVTLQLDMTQYTGSFNAVEVFGSFNNWQGGVSFMTDADSDGIYDITIPIATSSIEFLYAIDTGNFDYVVEDFTTSQPFCTVTAGPFTNRASSITGDTTFAPVCWESCVNCGAASTSNVTFQLDLNQYQDPYNGVEVFGSFNNWQGGISIMTDANNDGVYDITIPVTSNNIEFLFALDTGTFEYLTEDFTSTQPYCTMSVGQFTNRNAIVTADTIYASVCWESCSSCSGIGLDESSLTRSISVTPNPTKGAFVVTGTLPTSAQTDIRVVDLQGRTVYASAINGQALKQHIELSDAPNGLYLVHVQTDHSILTEKIIIQK